MMHRTLALVAILTANVLAGLSYILQKQAVIDGIPPATVGALRTAVAIALLGAWILSGAGVRWSFTGREWRRLVTIGVFGSGIPLLLGVIGIKWSTAGNGSILVLLEPISILFFSWLLLKEQIRRLQLLGIAVGLAGALLIVVGDLSFDSISAELVASRYLQGNVILAIHGILWGLYTPLMKPLATRYRSVDLAFAVSVLAMVPLLPASLLESNEWQVTEHLGRALLLVVLLGVVVSLFSFVLWNYALKTLRATTVAPFIFLQPVVGCWAGYVFLGEELSVNVVYGGILIAVAVALVSRR